MAPDFDFWRDYKNIIWTSTIVLNCFRAFVAGLVWMVIFLITGINHNINELLLIPIAWPVLLAFLFPLHLIFQKAIPIIGGILYFVGLILTCPADPFLFIIHKHFPQLVPVEQYPIFSKNLIIFVLGG